MAFTTTNVQRTYFGNLKVTRGDWSGLQGDAAGSIGVEGGRVWLAQFNAQISSGPYQEEIPYSISTSGDVTTLTVYYTAPVTAGTFIIIHS